MRKTKLGRDRRAVASGSRMGSANPGLPASPAVPRAALRFLTNVRRFILFPFYYSAESFGIRFKPLLKATDIHSITHQNGRRCWSRDRRLVYQLYDASRED